MCSMCMGINSGECPQCGPDIRPVDCPDCSGTGTSGYLAISVRTGEEIYVTFETYVSIPATASEAYVKGQKYYRGIKKECVRCEGTGHIWKKH